VFPDTPNTIHSLLVFQREEYGSPTPLHNEILLVVVLVVVLVVIVVVVFVVEVVVLVVPHGYRYNGFLQIIKKGQWLVPSSTLLKKLISVHSP